MVISSQDAHKFRLKHAEELLALFEGARGRPARTTDELAQWLDSVDDDLADDIAREVAEEAGRKAGREAAKKKTGKLTKKRAIGLMSGLTSGCLKASKRLVGKIIPD
jgi:hypothetical protein